MEEMIDRLRKASDELAQMSDAGVLSIPRSPMWSDRADFDLPSEKSPAAETFGFEAWAELFEGDTFDGESDNPGSGYEPAFQEITPGLGFTADNTRVVCAFYERLRGDNTDAEAEEFVARMVWRRTMTKSPEDLSALAQILKRRGLIQNDAQLIRDYVVGNRT